MLWWLSLKPATGTPSSALRSGAAGVGYLLDDRIGDLETLLSAVHGPTFVLTHHPRDPIEMEGGTTFIFVTNGIEAALDQAKPPTVAT